MVMVCAKVHTRPMCSSTALENPKSLFGDFAIRANDGNIKLFCAFMLRADTESYAGAEIVRTLSSHSAQLCT